MARDCGWTAIQLHESSMTCEEAVLTNAGHYLRARRTSYINGQGVDVSGSNGHGVNCNEGSKINFRDGIARDCGKNAREGYNDPPEQGMLATECSTLSAMNAIVTGAATEALFARGGAFIDFRDGQASSAGDFSAMRVKNGSFISASNASGTLSQPANAMTPDGVIFDTARPAVRTRSGEFVVESGEEAHIKPDLRGGKITLLADGDSPFPSLSCSGEGFFDVGKSPNVLKGPCGDRFEMLVTGQTGWKRGFSGKSTLIVEQGYLRIINRMSKPGQSMTYRYSIV